jgi:hypothetical protein
LQASFTSKLYKQASFNVTASRFPANLIELFCGPTLFFNQNFSSSFTLSFGFKVKHRFSLHPSWCQHFFLRFCVLFLLPNFMKIWARCYKNPWRAQFATTGRASFI